MVKRKDTKPNKYKDKGHLSLGKSNMVKLNMSFEELAKRAVKVEVKGKKKEDSKDSKEKGTSNKE